MITTLCRDVRYPNGLQAFGYGEADIPALAAGAFKQQRLLAVSPRSVTEPDLADILRGSLRDW